MTRKALALTVLLAAGVAGCGEPTRNDRGRLAIRFAAIQPRGSSAGPSASPAPGTSAGFSVSMESLLVTGDNGTLRIEDVRMIVSGFELQRADGACVAERSGCDPFEGGPFLVDLPLAGGAVTVTRQEIPAGDYNRLAFGVERRDAGGALDTLRSAYPGFPGNAGVVVRGSFAPAGGSARPFTVYVAAGARVERALEPPAEVPDADALTVVVDPARWFRRGGQVVDLAALDGRVVDVALEASFGAVEIEN